MSPAASFAAFLMRRQTSVFACSVLAGAGVTFATGRPAHELLLTHGARRGRGRSAHARRVRGRLARAHAPQRARRGGIPLADV